jgi:hypothetical protein
MHQSLKGIKKQMVRNRFAGRKVYKPIGKRQWTIDKVQNSASLANCILPIAN